MPGLYSTQIFLKFAKAYMSSLAKERERERERGRGREREREGGWVDIRGITHCLFDMDKRTLKGWQASRFLESEGQNVRWRARSTRGACLRKGCNGQI